VNNITVKIIHHNFLDPSYIELNDIIRRVFASLTRPQREGIIKGADPTRAARVIVRLALAGDGEEMSVKQDSSCEQI